MSEGEVLEAIAAFTANSINAFTVYISFTFAFLALCYFAGAKLKKNQAILASFLYLLSAGSAVMANYTNIVATEAIILKYPTVLDDLWTWDMSTWKFSMLIMLVSGMIACLYFLWDIRSNGAASTEAQSDRDT